MSACVVCENRSGVTSYNGVQVCPSCQTLVDKIMQKAKEKIQKLEKELAQLKAAGATSGATVTCAKQHKKGACGEPAVNGQTGPDARCFSCGCVDAKVSALDDRGLQKGKKFCTTNGSHGPAVYKDLCLKCALNAEFSQGKASGLPPDPALKKKVVGYQEVFNYCKVKVGLATSAADKVDPGVFQAMIDTLVGKQLKPDEEAIKSADLRALKDKQLKPDEKAILSTELANLKGKQLKTGEKAYDPISHAVISQVDLKKLSAPADWTIDVVDGVAKLEEAFYL